MVLSLNLVIGHAFEAEKGKSNKGNFKKPEELSVTQCGWVWETKC